MKTLIIADDFTGAADTGLTYAKRGYSSKIVFEQELISNDIDCIILDTETRDFSEEGIHNFSKKIQNIDFDSFKIIYKKIDSTLRGNIKQETSKLLDYYQPDVVVFAPAYPIAGRTTANGIQYLNGVKLMESEIRNDQFHPIKTDDLRELMSIDDWKLEILNRTAENIEDHHIYIGDASNDEDLQDIASIFTKTDKRVLWIGSAGLCEHVIDKSAKKRPV